MTAASNFATEPMPSSDDFAAMLDESMHDRRSDRGLRDHRPGDRDRERRGGGRRRAEVRGPRALEGILHAGASGRGPDRRSGRGLRRALRDPQRRGAPVAREGAARGKLEQARAGVQGHLEGHRLDLRPGQGRVRGRSRRRGRIPAGQPGRHPAGARRRRPCSTRTSRSRSSRWTAGAATSWSRAARCSRRSRAEQRNELLATLKEGQVLERRGQEHHRLRRLRRPRRPRRPAPRHRHLLEARQPPDRGAERRPARSRSRSSASTARPSASRSA